MDNVSLSTIDYVIIIAYAIFSIGIGVWLGRKNEDAEDYFLAGRNMRWPVIGGSLFASNISTTTMVGLAGAAYTFGIVVYNYEWMAAVVLAFFAIFFLRVVLRSGVYTMPEFLEKRFGGAARTYFAVLTLFLNIVVDTAGSLYAGALIFDIIFPSAELWQIVAVLAIAAGIYTIVGGLSAVMVTDVIQGLILVFASIFITIFALQEAGGWNQVISTVASSNPEKLSLIRPIDDEFMPWPTLLLGVPLLGFYFWCTNQFMIQRVLAAKNENEGRWGALFAGALKIPTLFIMVIPGTAAILIYPNLETGDQVFAHLMFDLLPAGLLGLALAGFVAALMSQIDSTLNSASTLVTMDFVRRYRPHLNEVQLMRIGQMATFTFMLLAVLWAPQIERFDSIFKYLQDVLAFAVGPVIALFVWGVFWKRANATGANTAIIVGVLLASILFYLKATGQIGMNNLYVAPIVFFASSVTLFAGSLISKKPEGATVEPLVWTVADYHAETESLKTLPFWKNYRILSVALLMFTAAVIVAWW